MQSCSCPATTQCYHIIVARLSVRIPVQIHQKVVQLTQLRHNMRTTRRREKRSGSMTQHQVHVHVHVTLMQWNHRCNAKHHWCNTKYHWCNAKYNSVFFLVIIEWLSHTWIVWCTCMYSYLSVMISTYVYSLILVSIHCCIMCEWVWKETEVNWQHVQASEFVVWIVICYLHGAETRELSTRTCISMTPPFTTVNSSWTSDDAGSVIEVDFTVNREWQHCRGSSKN